MVTDNSGRRFSPAAGSCQESNVCSGRASRMRPAIDRVRPRAGTRST